MSKRDQIDNPTDIFGTPLEVGDQLIIMTVSTGNADLEKAEFVGVNPKSGGFRVRRWLKSWGKWDAEGKKAKWNAPGEYGWKTVLKTTTLINNQVVKFPGDSTANESKSV